MIFKIESASIEASEEIIFNLKENQQNNNYQALILLTQKCFFDRYDKEEERKQAGRFIEIYNALNVPTYFCITEQHCDSTFDQIKDFLENYHLIVPDEHMFNFTLNKKQNPQQNLNNNDRHFSLLLRELRSPKKLVSNERKISWTFISFAFLFIAIFLIIVLKQSQNYDALQLDFEVSTDTILTQNQQYAKLNQDFEVQKSYTLTLNETVKDLMDQIKTQNEKIQELNNAIDTNVISKELYNKTLIEKEQALNNYKDQVSQQLVSIEQLTKDVSLLKQNKEKIEGQVKDLSYKEQKLNYNIEDLQKELKDSQKQIDQINNSTLILENEIEEYKNNDHLNSQKIEELLSNITEVNHNYTKSLDTISELEYNLETSLSNITSQQQSLEEYKKLIDEFQKNDTSQDAVVIEQSQKITILQDLLNSIDFTLSKCTRDKDLLNQTYNQTQQRLEDCNNESSIFEAENIDLKFNSSEQNQQLRNLNDKLNDLKLTNSDLVAQNSLLILNQTNLQNQINQLSENEENQQIITVSKQSELKQFVDFLQEQEVIDTFLIDINNQTYNISDSQVRNIIEALESSFQSSSQLILAERFNSKFVK